MGRTRRTTDVANTLYAKRGKVDRPLAAFASELMVWMHARLRLWQPVLRAEWRVEEATRSAGIHMAVVVEVAGFRPGMGQFIPDRLFWASRRGDAAAILPSKSPGIGDAQIVLASRFRPLCSHAASKSGALRRCWHA